jgi:tetratricopeptide (TPR) repeat protein
MEQQRWEEALPVLHAALQRHPHAAQAWYGVGVALLQTGYSLRALAAFERSSRLQADFDLAWYGKGLVLLQENRLQEALEALDRAVAVNPQCVLAWFRKAEALEALGFLDAAQAAYERVLQPDMDSGSLRVRAERQLQLLRQKSSLADS